MAWPATVIGRAAQYRDLALAGALAALGEAELFGHELYNARPVWPGPLPANMMMIAVLAVPFAWRRRQPLAAALAVFAVLTASSLLWGAAEAATAFIALIAATFSGATHSRHVVWVAAAAVTASAAHGLNDPSSTKIADLTWTYGLVAISTVLGRAVWLRQHRIGVLESDAASAAERHTREVAAATAAERASIARDLHDIVSHAVSVIIVQAQVEARALPAGLDVAAASLAAIESSARGAMTELRELLRLLTPDDEPPATTRTASLSQVGDLVERCRTAGLTVQLDGDLDVGLSPLADLAAYRLIQEALTNTMRHAPGATARVQLHRHGNQLEIVVCDDGPAVADHVPSGTGRGILGMRERLTLAGGHLAEAAHDGNGFRVRAVVPLQCRSARAELAP